jgi:hypothetical protein
LLTGISKSMIWYVVRGKRVPCREYAERLATALQLGSETREELLDVSVRRAWPK